MFPSEAEAALRASIHDVAAMSALPAAWSGKPTQEIAVDAAEVLLRMLHLEFAGVELRGDAGDAPAWSACVRTDSGLNLQWVSATGIGLLHGGSASPSPLQHPTDPARIFRTAIVEIGPDANLGALVAASCNETFPTETDTLLLRVLANQAALAQQRALSEQVEADRAWLAAIVESSQDAIVGKTLDGIITSWNDGAERLFGYTAAEIIGQPVIRLIPSERRQEEERILQGLRRGERIGHFETVRVQKSGQRIEVSLTISPIRDRHGTIVGASKVARDITLQKQAEHALQNADRRKEEFLAILSHELRNPLAAIVNTSKIIHGKSSATPELHWCSTVLERQTQHMTRLIDDLLDVARINSGKIELHRSPVNLGVVISNALEINRAALDQRMHKLDVRLPEYANVVNVDAERLAQVLGNLLNNAAKFTEPGGNIWLSAEAEGSALVIRVKDTGVGIPPDELFDVFGLFTQSDQGMVRSRGGLGIGLTVVRKFVELHGGSVVAHSEGLGRGSEFVVRLPDVVMNPRPAAAAVSAVAGEAPLKLRVLVVDDNVDAASTLSMLLSLEGHQVRIAYDGNTAVESALAYRPHVMLLDLGLPGMNGHQVAQRVRASLGPDLLLVALTGWGPMAMAERTKDAGFDHHLTKPVNIEVIAEVLREHFTGAGAGA